MEGAWKNMNLSEPEGACGYDEGDTVNSFLDDRDDELEETLRDSLHELCSPDSTGSVLDIDPNKGSEEWDKSTCVDGNDYGRCEGYVDQLRSMCLGIDDNDTTNKEDDLSPFQRIARNMVDLTGNGGVLKIILQKGSGDIVPELSAIRVNYNAYLEYSDEPYDSSHLRKEESRLWLGKGAVMPGLEVGLLTMCKGEMARFLVRSDYAYGALGCPPRIPPNSTVLLEVELLGFIDCINVDDFYTMTPEERKRLKLEKVLHVALNERAAGNAHFQAGRYDRALHKYLKTLRILENAHLSSNEEESQMEASLLKVLLNLALCYLRKNRPSSTVHYALRALRVQPSNVKACFRLGQAHLMLGDYVRARYYLLRAQSMAPFQPVITHELKALEAKWQEFNRWERQMCRRIFKRTGGGNSEDAGCSSNSARASDVLGEQGKETFVSTLKELRDDEGCREMTFPVSLFTAAERTAMMVVAREMGFHAECLVQGTGSLVKIWKKNSQDACPRD
ncbi:inactive peptidyl-prolyl cis-trans isomerase FKBP6 isoform X1 [Lethenteron reissneri]|uniref:inactive peptidyl-prolyl cis-trans isomerase FKBP6 isoform X1 n=2 Tax=Lethenteron reissneri TaxID=7753 RepID=UPI002AB6F6E7|nr:inactive peptidyl-prolyl cis-trans isomerase FKBP6 isoform X1 [Lethenteron reissneri]